MKKPSKQEIRKSELLVLEVKLMSKLNFLTDRFNHDVLYGDEETSSEFFAKESSRIRRTKDVLEKVQLRLIIIFGSEDFDSL